MTNFESNQYGIEKRHLSEYFNKLDSVDSLRLHGVYLRFSGHGHYKIKSKWYVNDEEEFEFNVVTTNTNLTDAWKSGMQDLYEDGDDGFENWDDVVNSMLRVIDPVDFIGELDIRLEQ